MLLATIVFLSVVIPELMMPPGLTSALLPEKVLLVTFSVPISSGRPPPLLLMTPPKVAALLFVNVLLMTFSVPKHSVTDCTASAAVPIAGGTVICERAVDHSERATVVDGAAGLGTAVIGEGAVGHSECAMQVKNAAARAVTVAVGDRQFEQVKRLAGVHEHHLHAVVTADDDTLPCPVNRSPRR